MLCKVLPGLQAVGLLPFAVHDVCISAAHWSRWGASFACLGAGQLIVSAVVFE
jgi:hypothetical protein